MEFGLPGILLEANSRNMSCREIFWRQIHGIWVAGNSFGGEFTEYELSGNLLEANSRNMSCREIFWRQIHGI